MAGSNGTAPVVPGRVVVLLTGSEREQVWDELAGRADLELRDESSVGGDLDALVGIVDVVLHVTQAHSPVGEQVTAVREQVRAPVVLALVGERPGIVEEALSASVSDILILPQPSDVLAFSLRKASRLRPDGQERSCRVITVFSPKGGTGKSAIAVNLAVAFAEMKVRTLLVDLDVQFGDSGIMLGLDRPEKTLHDLMLSKGDLDADKLSGFVMEHPSGLHLLPAPLRPEEGEEVDAGVVTSLFHAARHAYEAIVVDTAPLFDPPVIAALDRSDELLLVSTPDVPSMKNVRLGLQTLELLRFPLFRVGLLANRSGMRGGASAAELAETVGRELRFSLPDDDIVPTSINSGVPAVILAPQSRFCREIRAVASSLMEAQPARPEPARRFGLLGGRR